MLDQTDPTTTGYAPLTSAAAVTSGLSSVGYISTAQISMAVYLAHHLRKPVLIEGPAGVGKTDLALSVARYLTLPAIRLQCYEGLDEGKALYEWKYGKQLLYTQLLKDRLGDMIGEANTLETGFERLNAFQDVFFSENFIEPRPLLKALQQDRGSVLLIDEIDKADEAFEAFLLEVLSDYQVTIPEIGTISARVPPIVFLTSNNVRDLGDALKRRCLHLYIDFPEAAREQAILAARVPGIEAHLLSQIVQFVQALRQEDIRKSPSISETVDWARALLLMNAQALAPDLVRETLNVLLKYESDIQSVEGRISKLLRGRDQALNSPR